VRASWGGRRKFKEPLLTAGFGFSLGLELLSRLPRIVNEFRSASFLDPVVHQRASFAARVPSHFHRGKFRRVSLVRVRPNLFARRCEGWLSSGMVALIELTPACRRAHWITAADASVAYPLPRTSSINPHPISTSPAALGGPFRLIDPTTVWDERSIMIRIRHGRCRSSARIALRCQARSPMSGLSGGNLKPLRAAKRPKSLAISASMSSGMSATSSRRSV